MDPAQVAAFPAQFQPPPPQPPQLSALSSADVHPTQAANLSQPLPSHPSYTEMIMAAILWDNSQGKEGGSSKRAIAKYIDRVYSNLPPTHSALLTHHLMRLKNSGHLVMVKNSYQLPAFRSVQPQQQFHHSSPAPSSPDHSPVSTPKRKPGRPPKAQTQAQAQVQPQAQTQEHQLGSVPGMGSGTDRVNAGSVSLGKRGRGRPPKVVQAVVNEVAPPQTVVNGVEVVKRRPGRPRKNDEVGGVSVGVDVGVDGAVLYTVGVGKKKRGWPRGTPRGKRVAGTVEKRVYSGKPRGRPRKNSVLVKHNSGQGQVMANENLLRKLEDMQSKIRDAVGVIRPHVAYQSATDALAALQQLEELATVNVTASAALSAPPVTTVAVDLTAPPLAPSAPAPESFNAATSNLTASTMMSFTAPPAMSVPLPFGMTVMPPFHAPSTINNREPMNWIPSSEAQS